MISKSKVIYFLTSIVVVLLILNILIDPKQPVKGKKNRDEISISEIENDFFNVLYNFGIEEEWISKNRIRKGKYDSLRHSFKISIPTSVSHSVIIKDLNEQFSNKPIILKSTENKKDGSSILTISSANTTKLSVHLFYSKALQRQYSQVAFLITEFESLDEIEKKSFYNLSFPCGILLQLESGKQKLASQIKQHNLQYFIELNAEADELDFELNNDLGLEKLSKNIKRIISNFNSPRHFFINRSKNEFNTSTVQYIINKANDRGRKIKYSESFNFLRGEDEVDLLSLVNFHLNTIEFGQSKIFRISAHDWFNVQSELIQFQKKGNKIVKPSSIL